MSLGNLLDLPISRFRKALAMFPWQGSNLLGGRGFQCGDICSPDVSCLFSALNSSLSKISIPLLSLSIMKEYHIIMREKYFLAVIYLELYL